MSELLSGLHALTFSTMSGSLTIYIIGGVGGLVGTAAKLHIEGETVSINLKKRNIISVLNYQCS